MSRDRPLQIHRVDPSLTRAEDVVAALVPLEREDGTLVLTEGLLQLPLRGPDSRKPVVGARGQQRARAVPVQGSHVLVAGDLWRDE